MTRPESSLLDADEPIDTMALGSWLRSNGARGWSQQHIDAAWTKLVRALDGDRHRAVAYLEHMASSNTYLWRWLARNLSDELLAVEVGKTLGRHPVISWPDMPGRHLDVDPDLTIDELIISAVMATSAYERIQTANLAQRAGLNHLQVICHRHEHLMSFQHFCMSHLSRVDRATTSTAEETSLTADAPYAWEEPVDPAPVRERTVTLHRPADIRVATAKEIEHYARRDAAFRPRMPT